MGQNKSISLQEVIDMSQDKADNLGWGYGVGHIKKMWQKDLDNRPFVEKQRKNKKKGDAAAYTQARSSAVGEATLACSNYQRDLGTEGEQPLEIGRCRYELQN